MLTRILPLWEQVRTGLWFFPALITLAGAILAWLMIGVTQPAPETSTWWLHGGDPKDAFQLLANLLTALITMATLALSITMVVLTLAAAQLGPRLIRSFMADWHTQAVLGLFVATIVYLVLVLRTLHGELDAAEVPRLAVTIGTGLVLACVFALVYFVHHLASSIVADTMIQRVGASLDAALAAHPRVPEEAHANADAPALPADDIPHAVVRLERGGYLQTVDIGRLVEQAQRAGALIALGFRPGHHVLNGCVAARIWPPEALDEELRNALLEAIVVGDSRTAAQDVEFSVRQLVEIALRALSSGINDPHTAISVVDRLGRALAQAMAKPPLCRAWRDSDGVVRVHAHFPDFAGIVDAALNEIRQAADGKPAVLIHMLVTLDQLAGQARHAAHREVLLDHVRMVGAAGRRSIEEPRDRAALDRRYARALARFDTRP